MEKLEILFSNEDMIAVVKPPGMPVQADKTGDMDMTTYLANIFLQEIYPIHRLDRPVGGVMVFARTKAAASNLSEQIYCHKIKKTYHAVLMGILEEREGAWVDYLKKDMRNNQSKIVRKNVKDAKEAKLAYQVLDERDGLSLVEIELETGRHHQIRVQASSRKVPVWGDRKYGERHSAKGEIALWSYELRGLYPGTKTEWCFKKEPAAEIFRIFTKK